MTLKAEKKKIVKRYNSEARIEIIRDHMKSHGGEYVAEEFLEAASASTHPAHDFFDWADDEAAYKWRLSQARAFPKVKILMPPMATTDLTDGTVTIKVGPLLVSPPETRHNGGRYIFTDSERGIKTLRDEGRMMFRQWMNRFNSVSTAEEKLLADELLESLKRDLPVKKADVTILPRKVR